MAKITTLLAQAPWAPDGDVQDRLELRAGLDALARLDPAAFEADPASWLATRHQPGQPPRTAALVRLGEGWALRSVRSDDEPLLALSCDMLRPGEIVQLRQPDATTLLFRVVAVEAE